MRHRGLQAGEQVIHQQPHAQRQQGIGIAAIYRKDETRRSDQVWRHLQQHLAFLHRLGDELEVELLQIPQPAVDELGRPTARARSEIVLLDQRDTKAAQARLARDARARDSTTNH